MIIRVGGTYLPVDAIDRIEDDGVKATIWSAGRSIIAVGDVRLDVLSQVELLMPRHCNPCKSESVNEFAQVKGRKKA